jgi:hypothetical protein
MVVFRKCPESKLKKSSGCHYYKTKRRPVKVDVFPKGEESEDPVSSLYVGFPVSEDAAVEEFNAIMEDIEAENAVDVDGMLGWAG